MNYNFKAVHTRNCPYYLGIDAALILDLGFREKRASFFSEKGLYDKKVCYPIKFMSCKTCQLNQIDCHFFEDVILRYKNYTIKKSKGDGVSGSAKDFPNGKTGVRDIEIYSVNTNLFLKNKVLELNFYKKFKVKINHVIAK